jgi:opine dehydrogenase
MIRLHSKRPDSSSITTTSPVSPAAVPSSETPKVLGILEDFFKTGFVAGTDALAVGMFNSNPVYHVPPSILNFKTVEDSERKPLHSLVTKRIGTVIDAVDQERISLATALGVHSESFWEFLAAAYGVAEGDFAERIVQGYGRQAFPEPDSVNHRYFTEDIPFGLVTWSSFADEVGLSLPLVDAFIALGNILCDKDFVAEGRTAASLGLQGAGYAGIRRAFIDGEV